MIQAADIILRRGLPEEFLDAEERKSATESALAEKSPREITAIGKKWVACHGPLPTSVTAYLKICVLQAFGRRLGMEQIKAVDTNIVVTCPGWTTKIFDHLFPQISDTGGHALSYNGDRNQLIIEQLATQNPAKQVMIPV